jgi:hypothetical protein
MKFTFLLAAITLSMLASPTLAAGSSASYSGSDSTCVSPPNTQLASPLSCSIAFDANAEASAASCTDSQCTLSVTGGATYTSSVPGLLRAELRVDTSGGSTTWACLSPFPATSVETQVSCSGTDAPATVNVAAGECVGLVVTGIGFTDAGVAMEALARASRTFCRASDGTPYFGA